MSIFIDTKIDTFMLKNNAVTDEYPYTRPLFKNSWRSLLNFMLGYITAYEPIIAPLFLGYEFLQYKQYDNTLTSTEEYILGWLAGEVVPVHLNGFGKVPNFIILKEMGMI